MSSLARSVLGAALLLTGVSAVMAASGTPVAAQSAQTGAATAAAAPVANQTVQTGASTAKPRLIMLPSRPSLRNPVSRLSLIIRIPTAEMTRTAPRAPGRSSRHNTNCVLAGLAAAFPRRQFRAASGQRRAAQVRSIDWRHESPGRHRVAQEKTRRIAHRAGRFDSNRSGG